MLEFNSNQASGPAQPLAATTPTKSPKTAQFIPITHEFIRTYLAKIGGNAFSVYAVLLKAAGAKDVCWPSHEEIAIETGLSVATIKRALKKLASVGLCSWSARYATEPNKRGLHRQTSNKYSLKIDRPSPLRIERIPQSDLTYKQKELKKKKNEQNSDVAAFQNSLNASEPLPDIVKRLVEVGMWPAVAEKLANEKPYFEIEQQIEWLPARNPKDAPAILYKAIKGNWAAPEGAEPCRADTTPTHRTTKSKPTSTPPQADIATTPEPDIRTDAIRAHEIFLTLPLEMQDELLEEARADVSPIWHERVGNVESPMSLGLWEIIRLKYPEKFL